MSQYHYFSDDEVKGLDKELCAMLDMARGIAGVPFVITCGLRTADQNSVLKGAVADSSHLTGQAVDLAVSDDHGYFCMLKGLYAAGFRRFGHYFTAEQKDPNNFIPKHLHVDIDQTKQEDCAWAKREQN